MHEATLGGPLFAASASGVLQDDPQWANWSIGQLRAQASIHQPAINPIVYTEMSLSFSTRFRTYFPTLEVVAP